MHLDRTIVAQRRRSYTDGSLPFRRLVVGRPTGFTTHPGLPISDTAGCQPFKTTLGVVKFGLSHNDYSHPRNKLRQRANFLT